MRTNITFESDCLSVTPFEGEGWLIQRSASPRGHVPAVLGHLPSIAKGFKWPRWRAAESADASFPFQLLWRDFELSMHVSRISPQNKLSSGPIVTRSACND